MARAGPAAARAWCNMRARPALCPALPLEDPAMGPRRHPPVPHHRRPRSWLPAALLAGLAAGLAGCAGTPAAGRAPTAGAAPAESAPAPVPRFSALLAAPERSAADRSTDLRRKADELLAFIAPRPGMVALDLSAAGGYTTELLARAIGPGGRVYGQSAPRNPARTPPPAAEGGMAVAPAPGEGASAAAPPPRLPSPQALAERAQRLQAGGVAAAAIVPVVRNFEDPVPAEVADGALDLVTFMFNYHDLGFLGVDRAALNRAIYRALKPGGQYVIADHAGRPGTGISESGTLHRIEETFLRSEVEAAGFRLAAQGDFLRNPNDPRDRNTPIPAQPKDEFVLKFVKP
jgi:predicted methyltransferase